MALEIKEKLGDGAYSDVYSAKDSIGRDVAVKIIRKSAGDHAFALKQAEALARITSRHVVRVLTVEDVEDPISHQEATGIVLELIDGPSLEKALAAAPFSNDLARKVGCEMCAGLIAIHNAGLVHADLHERNVLLANDGVRIIDILYYDTLAMLSTIPKKARIERDFVDLRRMLRRVLEHSAVSSAKVDRFLEDTASTPSIDELRANFETALAPDSQDAERELMQALGRFSDEAFVKGSAYATALAAEVPENVYPELLIRILRSTTTRNVHKDLIAMLWEKCDGGSRRQVADVLGQLLDAEVPNGSWSPHVQFLAAIGISGWQLLPLATRIRFEHAVVNDISTGRFHFYGVNLHRGGSLGIWVKSFFRVFDTQNQDRVIDSLTSLLRQGWDEQNYVGEYFMASLWHLCRNDGDKSKFIEAIKVALRANALSVKNNVHKLTEEWRAELGTN